MNDVKPFLEEQCSRKWITSVNAMDTARMAAGEAEISARNAALKGVFKSA